MVEYVGDTRFEHGEIPRVGILIANLGTPDAPTTPAVRRYLREFLSDPRVVELPRWKWQIILNLFVLTTRPKQSAHAYQVVWTPEGSPLLVTGQQQASALEEQLRARFGNPLRVVLGMRYGSPSMAAAVDELCDDGCRKILLLPLYPQYSAATTASTYDAFFAAVARRRWVPEVRTVSSYGDEPGYIRALAHSVRELWEEDGEPQKLIMSFHGIPERYFHNGDPYHCHCHKTGRLLAEMLELPEDRYLVTFQSRFGKEPWLQPYTDATLRSLGADGCQSVDVICPGFSADCLETIEEIDLQNREFFTGAGGGRFRYIPALNVRLDHLNALADVVSRHVAGWMTPRDEWDEDAIATEAKASAERAAKMQ